MASAPYNEPRLATRIPNSDDAAFLGDYGMFRVIERGVTLLAVINLSVAV